ncbi:MAG: RNase III inhibitor, partial [Oscillospiraceae bacterium]|nr:RNase III inhibitor [Oscillospiraceae bacterium]
DYRPNKSTAIQLALALELDTEQTQKLLEKAGYSLTRSSRADLVIQYFIGKGIFSIPEINMALFDCGLPLLKTGSGA